MGAAENIQEPSLKEKTAKGLFWGGFSNLVQQVLGATFGIFIARILSPDDYGLIGMLAIFTALANTILDSGFTSALINRKKIRHEDYNAVFWFSLLSGIGMYIVLFFCAPLIAGFYKNPELTSLSRLLFLSFLIGGAGMAHQAIMMKKLMVKERAKIDIIAVFVSGATGLLLALNGYAYWGLAIQTVSMTAISVILRWFYAPFKPVFKVNFKPIKEMFGYSIKLLITNIISITEANLFSVILGKFYNVKQVGHYYQGNKWMSLAYVTIGQMITGVAQPVFVETNDDSSRLQNVFRKMLRFGAFCSFPAMLGLAFVGKEFIYITLGEKWIDSVIFLQLLCVWGAFGYLWVMYTNLIMSYKKSNIILYGNLIVLVLQIIGVICTLHDGIIWMVTIYTFCYFIGLGIWQYFVHRLLGIRLIHVIKDIFPYLAITIGCFFITWLITRNIANIYLLFASKIVISASLYILIMACSKSKIFKESLNFIIPKK
jgi:O-antigen/teichoic acid export membrane protein